MFRIGLSAIVWRKGLIAILGMLEIELSFRISQGDFLS